MTIYRTIAGIVLLWMGILTYGFWSLSQEVSAIQILNQIPAPALDQSPILPPRVEMNI